MKLNANIYGDQSFFVVAKFGETLRRLDIMDRNFYISEVSDYVRKWHTTVTRTYKG